MTNISKEKILKVLNAGRDHIVRVFEDRVYGENLGKLSLYESLIALVHSGQLDADDWAFTHEALPSQGAHVEGWHKVSECFADLIYDAEIYGKQRPWLSVEDGGYLLLEAFPFWRKRSGPPKQDKA